MARLVTKFKYMKPGARHGAGGYARYIATREGVEKLDESYRLSPAGKNQRQLIERLLRDFPDAKDMLEYEDYQMTPSMGNASDLIERVLEDNAGRIMTRKTYADYIATRPRAERLGAHGLFTDDGVLVELSKVSEALNRHTGNVWTAIISLRREDAERLGFNTGARWRDMLRTQTQALAENLKIPLDHLKWFAAFHNESHHPHVHLIAYSMVENEGYLTRQGVANLRSSFAKDIFAQDLLCSYERQTERRDALRGESRKLVAQFIDQINCGANPDPIIEQLLRELAVRLSRTSGKKVYGYLKADVKGIVDAIVDRLASDERIAALYDLWYREKEEALRVYTEELPKRLPLSRNPDFKSIRNAVIAEALHISGEPEMLDPKGQEVGDPTQGPADNGNETTENPEAYRDSQEGRTNSQAITPEHVAASRDGLIAPGAMRLLQQLARLFQYRMQGPENQDLTDRKLKREIDRKKQAHGLKHG